MSIKKLVLNISYHSRLGKYRVLTSIRIKTNTRFAMAVKCIVAGLKEKMARALHLSLTMPSVSPVLSLFLRKGGFDSVPATCLIVVRFRKRSELLPVFLIRVYQR